MTLRDYAKTIKVNGNKVTLPLAGRQVTIEVEGGTTKGKGVKVGAIVLTALLAVIGIY